MKEKKVLGGNMLKLGKLEKAKWFKIVFIIIIPVLGIVGVVYTIFSYYNSGHKELSYEIGPVIPITNLDEAADNRIKVFFMIKK